MILLIQLSQTLTFFKTLFWEGVGIKEVFGSNCPEVITLPFLRQLDYQLGNNIT
jgi:hypothetical protein